MTRPRYLPEDKHDRYFRFFERTMGTLIAVAELIKIPGSIFIFNRQWHAKGGSERYWRYGIFWAFVKSIVGSFKWEILMGLGYSLPQILEISHTCLIHLGSFERSLRRDLLHKRKGIFEPSNCRWTEEEGVCFRYTPLTTSDKQVRLLHLHCGIEKDDEIEIDISYASLLDRPRYLALSYVWGEGAQRTHPISINGRRFYVAQSLFHALRYLRNIKGNDTSIPFWIDALSIDQSNDREKSTQVLLMKEIYARAHKVLVWLGPPSEESELALAKMKAIEAWFYLALMSSKDLEDDKRHETSKRNGDIVRERTNGYEPVFFFETHDTESLVFWEAITNFLENSWWGRCWIAQEVSSPNSHSTPLGNVEIVMGRQLQTISFRSTVRLLAFFLRFPAISTSLVTGSRTADLIRRAEKASFGITRLSTITLLREGSIPISEQIITALSMETSPPGITMEQRLWALKVRPMLNLFRGLACENPRDKVYAALPLVLPPSHSAFAPDYGLSTADVYTKVAEAFIKHENCLSILAGRSGTDTKMPSWAPDWRFLSDSYPLCTRIDTQYRPVYRCSGNTTPMARFTTESFFQRIPLSGTPTEFPECGNHQPQDVSSLLHNVLNVQGVYLDKIKILTPVASNSKAVRRPDWEVLVDQLPEYYAPTNEPTKHCYQRTLYADVGKTVKFDGSESFATWRQRLAAHLEVIEKGFRRWISQPHKNLPSYSILQDWEDIGGPATKLNASTRGIPVDENFFDLPEQSEDPDVSMLSAAESKKRLEERDEIRRVKALVSETTTNRVLCITEKGYMGLVPYRTKKGDQVVILFGGYTPFVLREREIDIPSITEDKRRWQLIGECYIHGFMDGEALEGLDEDGTGVKSETFVMV